MTAPVAALIIASAVTLTGVVGCFGPARPWREATARWIAATCTCWWYQAAIMWPHQARKLARAVLGRAWPDEGKHSPNSTMTPALAGHPAQARPGDPPPSYALGAEGGQRPLASELAANGEVRAGTDHDPDKRVPYLPAPAAAHPVRQPDAATATPPGGAATLPQPVSPGLGQPPGRDDTWVRHAPRHAATQPRRYLPDGTEDELLILPLASLVRTAAQPALDDLPPVPVRRCSTDVATFGDSLIAGLRAL